MKVKIEVEFEVEPVEGEFEDWDVPNGYARLAATLVWHHEDSDPTRQKFEHLASQWRAETEHLSSIAQRAMHPAYQQIIGMGRQAIPHILRDLEHTRDHWFWALAAISGENPVPPETRGDVPAMVDAWLRWAAEKGLRVGEQS